ncbi:MAG: low molecular weight phosphatase family protein [Planctomycetota bacterium]|nr:MAG: low molecular weight phosphatase family protein [Planctomycetota bacterium]
MKTVLFLCTGNYYRSRYAEILFNARAQEMGLAWNAVSRGLAPDPRNPGPMSRDTMAALQRQGITVEEYLRLPIKVTDNDFESNHHIVAVKEAEHRLMIQRDYPHRLENVEFWHVHDLDCCGPEEAISHLEQEVTGLLLRLSHSES